MGASPRGRREAAGGNDDPRLAAARYRADPHGPASPHDAREAAADRPDASADAATTRTPTAADRAAYVETAIQQAIRRGEFTDLPGAGRPLVGLGATHDPDWWIRRKIEREQLRGLGPPALMLRVENRELDARLDALATDGEVREVLDDFNARIRSARMQLLGGPPVVTPLRDVDAEIIAWHTRRAQRAAVAPEPPATGDRGVRKTPRRRWWRRPEEGT
ncbi:DUF1992 domain-containing protein [Microbacterium sp. cx-55]|uniref:DnaJ family domain-containing protein n=1 Tax=Microbacterium sp. cx-55 TaxID=2875948 RepID=UPI001CBA9E97|nr:DUF1992 domain-containing protein [Microbacterium sp. cx-55]MBZ4487661.1 DUF1992 domain-containing protein [Microbacterium sp. cx-55]UGB35673.1 DUF1992 domain-containing protein [Microbacterium sp. cx-55]